MKLWRSFLKRRRLHFVPSFFLKTGWKVWWLEFRQSSCSLRRHHKMRKTARRRRSPSPSWPWKFLATSKLHLHKTEINLSFRFFCLSQPNSTLPCWASSRVKWNIIRNLATSIGIWVPWWLRWWRICLQRGRPGFSLWVGKSPWRRAWLHTPIFCVETPHGQRSLVGYSPWGCKKPDTTEWLGTIGIFV